MRKYLGLCLLGLGMVLAVLTAPNLWAADGPAPGAVFNVRSFGASGNGARLETRALQKAIDACAQAGGGTVYFPAGTYLTGTLYLKSHVTLHLAARAVLSGSRRLEDYPRTVPAVRSYTDHYTDKSLIYGEGLEQIGITGEGMLDGNGAAFFGPQIDRPFLIRLVSCREVSVQGITLRNAAMWAQHYLACDDVRLDGITVRNRCRMNNDGMDIDSCRRVRVANCDIRSEDDAIVLKSTLARRCEGIVVTNCRLSSDCNALKLGTESSGGFADVRISDCVIYDTRCSGLALEVVDGGALERVEVSNLRMYDVESPIFIRLGNRARRFKAGMTRPAIGTLRHVRIRNILATGADGIGCSITGLPKHPAEDIALENIRITFDGGGKGGRQSWHVPERPRTYPEYSMFGKLPAYGFYCRHVSGLRFEDVHLDYRKPEARPSLGCDDVAGLELAGWDGAVADRDRPGIRLIGVRNVTLHDGPKAPETGLPKIDGQGEKAKLIGAGVSSGKAAVLSGKAVIVQ